jgi:integrase
VGIYKRGEVYWARWTEGGAQRRRSLGTKDPKEARRLYEELLSAAENLTVGEILSRWLKFQSARCRPRSVHLYKIVGKRFSHVWGDLHPVEVTTTVVEEFQESVLMIGLSPRTINHQVGIALSALKWAADRRLTDADPPKWKRLKVNGNRARKYLTPSELAKLLETVREPRWERLEAVVMLALYAGLRQQEIAWLTWSDIDLADGWLHIRPKPGWSPKSSTSERSVPIAEALGSYRRRTRRVLGRHAQDVRMGRPSVARRPVVSPPSRCRDTSPLPGRRRRG